MAPKRSIASKLLRGLAVVLGSIVILYLVAVAILSTQWFRRYLIQRATVDLGNLTGARVEIGAIEVRPLIFQASLRGLVLHGKESPIEPPLFRAETIVLGLDPRSIAQRQLRLRRLQVINAQVNLHTYPDGSTNVPGPRTSLFDDLLDLSIGTLTVVQTSFSWDNQSTPVEVRARNVGLILRHIRGGLYSGTLASSETKVGSGAWTLPPVSFATRLQFSRRTLEFSDWSGRLAAPAGLSARGWLKLNNLPILDAEFSFQGGGDVVRLAQMLKIPELRAGSFSGECQGTYSDGQARAEGRFRARDVAVRSPAFTSDHIGFATDYALDGRHVTLTKLVASLLDGTVQGRTDVTLEGSSPRFAAKLQVHGLDLERSLDSIPEAHLALPFSLASRVDGSLDAAWRGNFRDPESHFDLTLTPIEGPPGAWPVGGFAKGSSAMLPAPSLELEEAELHTPHSSLSLKGSARAQQLNLAVKFSTSDLGEWKPLTGAVLSGSEDLVLESTAAFDGSVSGSVHAPDIQGHLKAGAFRFRGWPWDGVEGTVDASPAALRVGGGKLLGRGGALMFDGSLGLEQWKVNPQAPVRLTAETERASIEGLRDTLKVKLPVTGVVTGRFNLEGTLAALTGSGTLRVEQGSFAGEPFDRLTADVRAAKSLFTFDAVDLRKDSGRVTGRAAVDLSADSVSLDLHGADFALASFKLLDARLPQRPDKTPFIDGRLEFDLQAQGTRDHPQLQSKFSLRSLVVNGTALGDLEGECEWHGEGLRAQVGVEGPGGKLHTTGAVQTQGDWPAEFKLEYSDLRADPWIALLRGQGLPGAAVTSSGSLTVTGPLKTPDRLEAHGQAQKLEVGLSDLRWTNDQPVELNYANGVLTASRFHLKGPSTDLQVEGSIQLAKPAKISGSIQGHGDAQLLQVFEPSLESTGSFDLNLRAAGTTERPSINGTLSIKNLGVAFGQVRVVGLGGDIQLDGDRFTVRSLRGIGGGGAIEISGNGTIFGTPRFDLRASLNQARIEFPPEITSSLSGTLHLAGNPQGGQLSGELSIRHSFVREDFNLLAWMGQIGNQPLSSPAGLASPWASKVSLDLAVTSSPEVRLESHDLTLVAAVDMNVRGTLADPVGFGDVRIESGEAVIRGDRYKLTRGDINLTNPFRTQATVDIAAQTRVQRYDLTLEVAGPTDRLKISYRSDPPLPTSDILALLALGYSSQQQTMSATGGASQTFNTVGTSALLSQALSTQVSGRLQRLFGVSRIKVDPNVYGPGVSAGPRITIEEQITRDVSLTYSTNTAGVQQQLIQFEYALSDRISLIGERDQNGVYGVEVRFRHRFK